MALVALGVVLVVISAFTATQSDVFLTLGNLRNILLQVSVLAIISSAMTLLMVSGGIDLAVGQHDVAHRHRRSAPLGGRNALADSHPRGAAGWRRARVPSMAAWLPPGARRTRSWWPWGWGS